MSLLGRSSFLKFSFLAAMLLPSSAFALPMTLDVDFRGPAWAAANGAPSLTVGDVAVSIMQGGTQLFQDSVDGIGVLGGENDEIDALEVLQVNFLNGGLLLSGVWITDLFDAVDGSTPRGETGWYMYTEVGKAASTRFSFFGDVSDQANGEQLVNFGSNLLLESIKFGVFENIPQAAVNLNFDSEFSVAGFDAADVPEPTSVLLLGLGLLGALACRRQQAK